MAQKGAFLARGRNITAFSSDTPGVLRLYRYGDDIAYDAMAPGTATIHISGPNFEDELTVTVIEPTLRLSADSVYLPLDGTSATVTAAWYDKGGNRMDKSDFDDELYDSLLELRFEKTPLRGGSAAIEISGYDITAYLEDVFDPGDGTWPLVSVAAMPASSAVSGAAVEFYTLDPFPESASFPVDAYALAMGLSSEVFSLETGSILGFNEYFSLSCGRENEGFSVNYSSGFANVEWTLTDDKYLPSSSEKIHGSIRNFRSDRSWTSSRTWTMAAAVHVAIGGEVFHIGGSTTKPMNYGVRAVWSHEHDFDNSPLVNIDDNVVAAVMPENGYYPVGLYSLLYRLSPDTGYPANLDDTWYELNTPQFTIVRADADNVIQPVPADIPYRLDSGSYHFIIHNYSDFHPGSLNWAGR